ncbi:cathepsin W-like [Spea bombifrons]|uniref:cathepsin W-like n=1 Tax=Spea bombifrons TaxID=233779 RepID=UPI00234AFAE3|nr:cathepsin W-like [Spea bombifrons]
MALLCSALALAVISPVLISGNSEMAQFENFILRFNKTYKNEEEFKDRLLIFSKNMEKARLLQKTELGTAKYGVTKFSDLTDEEFSSYHLGTKVPMSPSLESTKQKASPPKTCDWRKKRVISKVKDQGQCYSCWAFAAVANIEAQLGILGDLGKELSEQQLVDCNTCKNSCEGSFPWDAFITVLEQGGLASEAAYPYTAKKGSCKTVSGPKASITGFKMIAQHEEAMTAHLAHSGTLTVVINKALLKSYTGGIIDQKEKCDPTRGDHVVLIVGYSKEMPKPYWILKNSWGENWGENGYFRLQWGKNMCGITTYPMTATFDKKKRPQCPP